MGVHENGLIAQWNQRNPSSSVRLGDALMKVNGIVADSEHSLLVLEELKKTGTFEFVLQRTNRPLPPSPMDESASKPLITEFQQLMQDYWLSHIPLINSMD